MDWEKTTTRRDEKHLSSKMGASYIWGFIVHSQQCWYCKRYIPHSSVPYHNDVMAGKHALLAFVRGTTAYWWSLLIQRDNDTDLYYFYVNMYKLLDKQSRCWCETPRRLCNVTVKLQWNSSVFIRPPGCQASLHLKSVAVRQLVKKSILFMNDWSHIGSYNIQCQLFNYVSCTGKRSALDFYVCN